MKSVAFQEVVAAFVAYLASYTWVLWRFFCAFQHEASVCCVKASESWQNQWLLWVYVTCVTLGEVVTNWSCSCKRRGGWSQQTMNTHAYQKRPVILAYWLRRKTDVLLTCWPLKQTPSVSLGVCARWPDSSTVLCSVSFWFLVQSFKHLLVKCCILLTSKLLIWCCRCFWHLGLVHCLCKVSLWHAVSWGWLHLATEEKATCMKM